MAPTEARRIDLIRASPLVGELVRYVLGGLSTMVVCWGGYFVLLQVSGWHYLLCLNLSTLLAWGYSYLINKYIVFRNRERGHVIQGSKFFTLQGLLLALSNVLMFVQIDLLGWPQFVSLFLVTALATVLNFSVMKILIFARQQV